MLMISDSGLDRLLNSLTLLNSHQPSFLGDLTRHLPESSRMLKSFLTAKIQSRKKEKGSRCLTHLEPFLMRYTQEMWMISDSGLDRLLNSLTLFNFHQPSFLSDLTRHPLESSTMISLFLKTCFHSEEYDF